MRMLSVIVLMLLLLGGLQPAATQNRHAREVSRQDRGEPELVDRGNVRYPLAGRIALTNVGKPVRGMKVECFVNGWRRRVAVTETNSRGGFSFPELPEGTYYLRLRGTNVSSVRTIVTTKRKFTGELSLTTEGCDRDCDSDPVLK